MPFIDDKDIHRIKSFGKGGEESGWYKCEDPTSISSLELTLQESFHLDVFPICHHCDCSMLICPENLRTQL